MKNKEEPSIDLTRGNPSTPADRQIPGCQSVETTGSIVRQDGAAPASIEKPALSLFPESLMEAAVTEANVEQAWRNVKANRGAPGPDGITISEFPAWFRLHWPQVRSQLLDGTYRPSPVRRVTIDKPDGGDLRGVAAAANLSRKTMRNIRQNLFFAFVYNALGIPVAAGLLYPFFGILLSPMIAAAAMSLSSVSVIVNALRLRSADLQ
jgi:hypothetical protein